MPELQEFNILEAIKGVGKSNLKIVHNYLNNISGYHHDVRDISQTFSDLYSKVLVNPREMIKIYDFYLDFLTKQQQAWHRIFIDNQSSPPIENQKSDKRFLSDEWRKTPFFNFIEQSYLLTEKFAQQVVDEAELDDKNRRKLDFYVGQYMDAFSPANFLLTNPEALKLAVETKGESLWNGFANLVKDIEKGRISQTDESAFEVGKNIAATPGMVVYENELIQLIQYTPITKNVYEIPLLLVPPWINKYYILDLQQKNSFVKFLIEKGITVFVISWRNPQPNTELGNTTFDTYVEKGALKAIETVQAITNAKRVNTLGYCLGGTLLSIACSILASKKKENPVNSATFLASMIDFSYIGPIGDVIDGALMRKLERGELLKNGVLHGQDMEHAFNLIRANDLIWNYAVTNYLKGITPSAFDVINWTNDNTNLPSCMYLYYLKHIIVENKLSRKNALRICDTPIDIGKIDFPVYVVGFKEDYISPAQTCFTTTKLVSGSVEFILGGSGHVIGVINPPSSKKRYGYYTDGKMGYEFEDWLSTAQFHEGSWWTPWSE
ncbi:MAG TPA: alpha/beta fold hydrolase, partial [Bacteroidia bacterium]